MKKIGGLLIVAIAAATAFKVNISTQESGMSLLTLMNIEALANNENEGSNRARKRTNTAEEFSETIKGVKFNCTKITEACEGQGDVVCTSSSRTDCRRA